MVIRGEFSVNNSVVELGMYVQRALVDGSSPSLRNSQVTNNFSMDFSMREDNFKFEIGESVLMDGKFVVEVVGRSYKNSGFSSGVTPFNVDTNFYELKHLDDNLSGRWESSLSKMPQPHDEIYKKSPITVKIPSSIEVIKKTDGEYVSIPKKDFKLLMTHYNNRTCGKILLSDGLTELFERWLQVK